MRFKRSVILSGLYARRIVSVQPTTVLLTARLVATIPGNIVAALAVHTDDTPRPGVDPPHTPSHTPLTESEDILHPVSVKPSGIIVSVDELMMRKSTPSVLSSARVFIEWRTTPKLSCNNLYSLVVRPR